MPTARNDRTGPSWLDSLLLAWLLVGAVTGVALGLYRAGLYLPLAATGLLAPGARLIGESAAAARPLALVAANAMLYALPLHALRVVSARLFGRGRLRRGLRLLLTSLVIALVPLTMWLGEPRDGATLSSRLPETMAEDARRLFPPPPLIDDATLRVEEAIVHHTNRERAERGLVALEPDPALADVARAHSVDMIRRRYLDHQSPDGRGPTERAQRAGYPVRRVVPGGVERIGIGENIGVTAAVVVRRDPGAVAEELVARWMESAGHRANLLEKGYAAIGVGVAFDGYRYAATQNFR